LAPKRNEKSGEHKVDVLCLLLSLIGGIKDFENVFVIASTNRLNKMDEAFCRRLQVKFFVGRLDPERRLNALKKICEENLKNGNPKFYDNEGKKGHENQLEYLKKLTTNFSGAAIESFRSRIVSYMIKVESIDIRNEILTKIADKVARDFQILLGSTTIPNLLEGFSENQSNNFIYDYRRYTGKILVDLSCADNKKAEMQLEYEDEKEKDKSKKFKIQVVELPNAMLTHDVIPVLLKLSIHENVDFIQMFDTYMLLNNAAFDDNTVMETVLEKISEWQQYPRSMAIFDVDSLIGVNENMSDSSMGQSNSYSITNNRLWQQVVIQTANSKLNDTLDTKDNKNHKWVVVITKIQFMCKQFKSLTRFPLTEDEINEIENNTKPRMCLSCNSSYTNGKNNIDSCSYHDGPLVDIRVKERKDMFHLEEDNLQENFLNLRVVDGDMGTQNSTTIAQLRQDMSKNFIYLCCLQAYKSTGCKKDFHSDEKIRHDKKKYETYF